MKNGSAYTEIMSGCSATSSIRRMAGELLLAERGDSLYLMYEVYKFSTSFSETSTGDLIIYQQAGADARPGGVEPRYAADSAG